MMFQGVVEDRNDPLKLGRIKVRIFGIHTEERTTTDIDQYIPVANLPWAEAAFPISSSNISGISDFMVPQHGSIVWLFFKDPEQQYPVYFATSPKIEKVPDFTEGFTDPDSTYPDGNYTDESGVSKLAKGTNTISKTPVGPITSNAQSWSEPASQYATEYPDNRVIQTKYHVIEIDDTDGAERIHIWHKSGTSVEYHPNGDIVERVKTGNRYLVIEDADNNVYVKGNYNITVDGDCNIDATGSVFINGGTGVTAADGVITAKSVCPYTGNPHVDPSLNVFASKT